MKNKPAVFFLLAAIVLAGIRVWQRQQLKMQQLRLRVRETVQQAALAGREDLENRLKESERARARLERDLQEFAAVTAVLRSSESKQNSNLTALASQLQPGGKEGTEADGSGGVFGKGMGEMLSKMMKDPAMREIMRAQQKATLNLMYSGLFKELKLSPELKEKLTDTLLDNQMKNIESAQGIFGKDKGDGTAVAKSLNEQKKEADEQIKGLLGDEKFAQYEDYQKNVGERMQLDQLRNQLDAENLPLQDLQASQLLQIMKDEKERVPSIIPSNAGVVPEDFKTMFTSEKMDQQLQWMEDYNKRVLDRAGQVLTPAQLQQFTELQTQQASMQKLGLKMAREMFGK